MSIYDDIDRKITDMSDGLGNIERMLTSVSLGIMLYPVISKDGKAASREFLVKIAATIVHGIELIDTEIQNADECEHP